jgi:perosamine synthetase
MSQELAINGGTPVRGKFLPYGSQWLDEDDIQAVADVLRSDWITTGPKIDEFEQKFAEYVGSKYAVAVSSGTAALHAAVFACGIGPGDEVITTPLTFAASANCVIYQGGKPVFADVNPDTLNINPKEIEKKITDETKAIIAVDYTGLPCDYDEIHRIAGKYDLLLIEDASHAIGAEYKGRKIGSISDLTTFSFHPVKHITTGEGGMIMTDDQQFAEKLRIFRNHGITTGARERQEKGAWFYEMVDLGYNYRITDFQCALGMGQLAKLDSFLARRREIAGKYNEAFADLPEIITPSIFEDRVSAWHLYVIRLNLDRLAGDRSEIFAAFRAENIGVNVHYIPVYWHPYYQKLGYERGICANAETAYKRLISLPIFSKMTDEDIEDVVQAVVKVVKNYHRL